MFCFQPRRDATRKTPSTLAPVIDLKKKDDDESMFDPGLGFTIFPLARVRQLYIYKFWLICIIYIKTSVGRKKTTTSFISTYGLEF